MKSRGKRILAWGLSAWAGVGAVVHVIFQATHLTGPPTVEDIVQAIAWGLLLPVVFAVLAGLIITRQPGNRVGWLMMIIAVAASNPTGLLLGRLTGPPTIVTPGLWLALWLDGWSWVPMIFPVLLIPLFFPTGRPPTSRWLWVGRLAILMWVVLMFLGAFGEQVGPLEADWSVVNPVGFIAKEYIDGPLFNVAWGIGLVSIALGSMASLFVRYRRAGSDERQQIKWLLFAAAFLAVFYTAAVFISDWAYQAWWFDLLFGLSILAIPVAIAIAIFRYRLWDLEVVVNRALIYGLLTTLLAGIFAGIIALVTEVGKELLGEGSRALGAAISALIVAVIFQPLRDWIEAAVNRRFYSEKMELTRGPVEVQPEYWGFLDCPTLLRISMEHVRRVLGTNRAIFFLATEGEPFDLVQQAENRAECETSLVLSEKERGELEKKRVIAAEGSGGFARHVPVYVDRGKKSELLAVLSIGRRENGKGYSGDDLKSLAELGGKIGRALRAIQLGSPDPCAPGPRPRGDGSERVPRWEHETAEVSIQGV